MKVESIELLADGNLAAVVSGLHPDFLDEHIVLFHPDAVENRRDVYGCATPEEAVAAIMREHAVRLNDDLTHEVKRVELEIETPEDEPNEIKHFYDHGGLHPDVEVTFSSDAMKTINKATS